MESERESQSPVGVRWYQHTWLWLIVTLVALLVTAVMSLVAALTGSTAFSLVGTAALALVTLSLWVAMLVARRGWARIVLGLVIVTSLGLSSWAVWNFMQTRQYEAQAACEFYETNDGEVLRIDPELCQSFQQLSFDAEQRPRGEWADVGRSAQR